MRASPGPFECSVNDSVAPLILYSFQGKPSDPTEVQRAYLDLCESNYKRYPAMAEVLDFTLLQLPSQAVREYVTAWTALHYSTIAQHCVASCTVVRSTPMRWILAGWFKLQPPPAQNYRTWTNLANALDWAYAGLIQKGVNVDAARFESLLETVKYQRRSGQMAS